MPHFNLTSLKMYFLAPSINVYAYYPLKRQNFHLEWEINALLDNNNEKPILECLTRGLSVFRSYSILQGHSS